MSREDTSGGRDKSPLVSTASEEADRATLERHASLLLPFLRRRLPRDPDAVPDLSQETLERYISRQQKAAVREPVGLLYSIATNVLREFWYRKRRNREHVLVPAPSASDDSSEEETALDFPDVTSDPYAIEANRQLQTLLDKAMQKLGPIERAVHVFREQDGLSVEETARRCGISVHKAERYSREARQKIATFLIRTHREKDIL